MKKMLCELGLEAKADALIDLLRHNHPIRGAVLYDVATNSRLEPDHERGIRVTYMDAEGAASNCSGKTISVKPSYWLPKLLTPPASSPSCAFPMIPITSSAT